MKKRGGHVLQFVDSSVISKNLPAIRQAGMKNKNEPTVNREPDNLSIYNIGYL